MVRILEQLQFGVHRADAVHGREAELDVGGDVASHEGFLNLGGKRIGQLHYILPFSILYHCISISLDCEEMGKLMLERDRKTKGHV